MPMTTGRHLSPCLKTTPALGLLFLGAVVAACSGGSQGDRDAAGDGDPSSGDGYLASYVYVWAADDDAQDSDFLAVMDVRPDLPTYAEVVATLPVGFAGGTHHTEHLMPEGGVLFANAFDAGLTFLIDLRDTGPAAPHGAVFSRR